MILLNRKEKVWFGKIYETGCDIMSEQRKQINYAVACVNEFARKYSLSAKSAFDYLFQYKAIEFLKENYEIEHTLSFEDAVEDMFLICQKNGGVL